MAELPESLVAWKGVAVLVWLAALFLAERLRPAAPRPTPEALAGATPVGATPLGETSARPWRFPPAGWRRVPRNLGLWLMVAAASPLAVLPISLLASEHTLGWRAGGWAAGWAGWPGLLLDLLILDLLIYWWHRANHEIPFLWRFHAVHHLDRFLDTSSALRFHVGEVLLSAGARALAIVLLDLPLASVLAFETLVLLSAIFHHSNLALPAKLERGLARLIVTPSIHWVHHHAVRRDTDSNYGTILSVWDPLFGSRSPTRRAPDMPIGVEGAAEETLVRLLLRPFRRQD